MPSATRGSSDAMAVAKGRPCRISDRNSRDILISALGDVKTPLAHGRFLPGRDEVLRRDGSRIRGYFRKRLGIRRYEPLDRSVFPQAPSGWCSWGYYGRAITEDEVLAHANWLGMELERVTSAHPGGEA
ncbi:MAG: hypothetical protein NTW87_10065 [Planctomycetota bacterium]|nr:hypothetical protein [Planctomycetota bacterium]